MISKAARFDDSFADFADYCQKILPSWMLADYVDVCLGQKNLS